MTIIICIVLAIVVYSMSQQNSNLKDSLSRSETIRALLEGEILALSEELKKLRPESHADIIERLFNDIMGKEKIETKRGD